MLKGSCFAALLAFAPSAALADSAFRAGLAQIPAEAYEEASSFPLPIYLADPRALAELSGGDLAAQGIRMRAFFPIGAGFWEVWRQTGAEAWRATTGTDLKDLTFVAVMGQPPAVVSVLGMESPEAVQGVLARLAERTEFEPVEGLEGALINGEPMKQDFARRDPADPWRGSLGQAVAVGGKGAALIHASAPEAIRFLRGVERSALETPILATALAGLESVAGEGEALQASPFTPVLGLESGFDPAEILLRARPGQDMAALRAEIEARMAETTRGVPPYFGGLLADAQIQGRPALVVALAYPDCGTAQAAAEASAGLWRAELPEPAAEVSASHVEGVEGVEGLCAAVILGLGEAREDLANPLASAALQRIMRGQGLPMLRIGAP
ncbi:hypothetical protein [Neomegalonema sp.]|uniref:hypothetical protein n=1 Tax=Neomegalonema sp. TaxID=2039713 RepID=UPI00260F9CEC|nr:hypothetical protein [Neomegalonema sp.]MDD2867151.1 hypothetical protein [Neomegalonema sp.]